MSVQGKRRLKMTEEQLNQLTLKEGLYRALSETKFNLLKKILVAAVVAFFVQLVATIISKLLHSIFILSSLSTLIGGLSIFLEMVILAILLYTYFLRSVQDSNLARLNDAGLSFIVKLANIMAKESKLALRFLIGSVGFLFLLSILILIIL